MEPDVSQPDLEPQNESAAAGPRPLTTRARRVLLGLAVFYVLCWLNAFRPVFRFSVFQLNDLFFFAVQIIPFALAGYSLRLVGPRLRWAILITTSGIAMVVTPVFFFACAMAIGPDSFVRISTLRTSRGDVAVYRTNGGATTSSGIIVRQQCALIPGLLVVRELANEYPAREANVEQVDAGRVRIVTAPYSEQDNQKVRTSDLGALPCLWSSGG